jgi:intein-encoded DNA endonuclease-like protein
MADRLADGQLATILLRLRSQDQTYDTISAQLMDEYGIEVTRQTIASWVRVLEAAA